MAFLYFCRTLAKVSKIKKFVVQHFVELAQNFVEERSVAGFIQNVGRIDFELRFELELGYRHALGLFCDVLWKFYICHKKILQIRCCHITDTLGELTSTLMNSEFVGTDEMIKEVEGNVVG